MRGGEGTRLPTQNCVPEHVRGLVRWLWIGGDGSSITIQHDLEFIHGQSSVVDPHVVQRGDDLPLADVVPIVIDQAIHCRGRDLSGGGHRAVQHIIHVDAHLGSVIRGGDMMPRTVGYRPDPVEPGVSSGRDANETEVTGIAGIVPTKAI